MAMEGIVNKLRGKRRQVDAKPRSIRRQFNIIVHPDIIDTVKRMAAYLSLGLAPISEHAMQIGLDAVERAVKDPERREVLRNHLVEDHQLSETLIEGEAAVHLTDTRYAADIMQLARAIDRHYTNLQRLIAGVREGEIDFKPVENCRRLLLQAAIELAERLIRHPLDQEQPVPSTARRLAPLVPWPRRRRPSQEPIAEKE